MKLALKADRLIDGTGADAVSNGAIVIENGKITEITTQQALQFAPGEDVEVIEVSGGSIMPGFIEMHSHMHCNAQEDAYAHIMTESDEVFLMRAVGAVRSALSSGVTTMRDLGRAQPGGIPHQAGDRRRHHSGPTPHRGRHSHYDHRRPLQHVRHRGEHRRPMC